MNLLMLTYTLNALLMVAMPLGLAIFLARRWKTGWTLWWIGAATFILSQVGHIPFNLLVSNLLNRTGMVYWSPTAQLVFNATFLGLSAGLFEECSRYLVLRLWARKARSWRAAVQFGAGHGGAEAILLGLLAMAALVSMLVLRSPELAAGLPSEQLALAQQQVAAYWSAPWFSTLLGALERLSALVCQVFMATLVMQAFLRRNIVWLFAAIGFHALLDASAVLGLQLIGVYWTEAVIAAFALLSLVLTLRLRQAEPLPPPVADKGTVMPTLRPVEETPEALDASRFQDRQT